jgi:hypothetical protein
MLIVGAAGKPDLKSLKSQQEINAVCLLIKRHYEISKLQDSQRNRSGSDPKILRNFSGEFDLKTALRNAQKNTHR